MTITNIQEVTNRKESKAIEILLDEYDNAVKISSKKIWQEIGIPESQKIVENFNKQTGLNPVSLDFYFRRGVPDILAWSWREGNLDYKFVEVKGGGDSVRENQVFWLSDFSELNSEIWFIENGESHHLVADLDAPFVEDKFLPYQYNDYSKVINKRTLQEGSTLYIPEMWCEENSVEPGDTMKIRKHSDGDKLVIEPA